MLIRRLPLRGCLRLLGSLPPALETSWVEPDRRERRVYKMRGDWLSINIQLASLPVEINSVVCTFGFCLKT